MECSKSRVLRKQETYLDVRCTCEKYLLADSLLEEEPNLQEQETSVGASTSLLRKIHYSVSSHKWDNGTSVRLEAEVNVPHEP